jgi:hypothetical protein
VVIIVCSSLSLLFSQKSLIMEVANGNNSLQRSEASDKIYTHYKNNPRVKDIFFIKLDMKSLDGETIKIEFDGSSSVAVKLKTELHDSQKGFSWFGRLSDETGIFFTVIDRQVVSKFYMGATPCLIVPLSNDIHLLVRYQPYIDNLTCGNIQEKVDVNLHKKVNPEENLLVSVDDNCTMRVLLVVTAQAEPEITMSLELAARMLQDETNLAYFQSLINLRMEIARVVRTNFVETTNFSNATAYGSTVAFPTDLLNLSSGSGLLNNIPAIRNQYSADVVVMVRSASTGTSQGLFGVAFGIPTGASAINPDNGFALISTEFMIGGRFTFAHEIGHIQGARHDNDNSTPSYARGFVFSTSGISNRTIMAVGGSCNPPTGCRVQFFSNPNVTFNSQSIGVTNERDNARRINETSGQILANRITSTNLLLSPETFDDGILARHLANQTISTNNNSVIALPGSRVSMRAGNSITMLPGFSARAGSNYSAYINTCSLQPFSLGSQNSVELERNIFEVESFDLNGLESEYQAYPIPVNSVLNVTHPISSRMLFLYDLRGKLLIQKIANVSGITTFELEGLTSGVYLLRIDSNKIIKIIVNK